MSVGIAADIEVDFLYLDYLYGTEAERNYYHSPAHSLILEKQEKQSL